jgi:hypothetical protein
VCLCKIVFVWVGVSEFVYTCMWECVFVSLCVFIFMCVFV